MHGREECVIAKRKELKLLSKFEVYRENGELLTYLWVVIEKRGKQGETIVKARFCARGCEEDADV